MTNTLKNEAKTTASRREFLKRSSMLSMTGAAAPWALNLAAMGEAAASGAVLDDYKALVCVFLYGGNDHGNTLVPYDAPTYDLYKAQRGNLATPRESLVSTILTPQPGLVLPDSRQYAMAPQLAPLQALFEEQRLSVLLNIGPLLGPTTKDDFRAGKGLPPKLFSHNDQQSIWQASQPEGASSGWGGRMGDLFAAGNGQSVFTAVSAQGNAVFLSGNSTAQYQVSGAGVVPIKGVGGSLYGSTAAALALQEMISGAPADAGLLALQHAGVVDRSISAGKALRSAIGDVSALPTPFPKTELGLGAQLEMVARMIAARHVLSPKPTRQVFFVGLGGFDHHDDLATKHPALLTEVAQSLAAFDKAMIGLGDAAKVTTFTASDFGRTLASNGDGSDHGWGSFHFVMGGAVKGGRFHGQAPLPGNNGPDDVGQGRMLPTMAVDQLAATLATWMGVSSTNLKLVVPNIGSYSQTDLGLFA